MCGRKRSFVKMCGLWPHIQHHPLSVACVNGAPNEVLSKVGKSVQIVIKDNMTADAAYKALVRKKSINVGLIWRGDFQVAKQLVGALSRRIVEKQHKLDRNGDVKAHDPKCVSIRDLFVDYRRDRLHRAAALERIFVPLTVTRPEGAPTQFSVPLRRAPNVQQACEQAVCPPVEGKDTGEGEGEHLVSLRGLLGCLGAHQWRRRGVAVSGDLRVVPHYGVFAPTHSEYVALVRDAALPLIMSHSAAGRGSGNASWVDAETVYEVGTGTGVLAIILASRGAHRVVATDCSERALVCARDNVARLGLQDKVTVEHADLFPEHSGRTDTPCPSSLSGSRRVGLVVCNPPWLPSVDHEISSSVTGGVAPLDLDLAVFDSADSSMLRGFLGRVAAHLLMPTVMANPAGGLLPQEGEYNGGECWLVLSDIAELFGLRSRSELLRWIDDAGLVVLSREDAPPRARKPQPVGLRSKYDSLEAARLREVVSLWRLGHKLETRKA